MTDFSYTAGGTLQTFGCPELDFIHSIPVAFPVGTTAYDRISASRGRMEAVVIKKVMVFHNKKTFGQYRIVYKDTLNSLYTDYDLLTHDDAKARVVAYLYRKIAEIDAELARRGC